MNVHVTSSSTLGGTRRLFGFFLLISLLASPLAAQEPTIASIEQALRAREFENAVGLCDRYLADKPEKTDHVGFLKALALFHLDRFPEAETAATLVASSGPESPWYRKARFLLAQAMIQQRNHEGAQAIYEEEARRLLSASRKEEIAGVLLRFADELAAPRDKNDLRPPPDLAKACNLYEKALALEISRELRDDLMFKLARTRQRQEAGQRKRGRGAAEPAYRKYLKEFDPDWLGPVGSTARRTGLKRENPPPAGRHRFHARFRLAEVQRHARNDGGARINLEDLLTLLDTKKASEELQSEVRTQLEHDARWQVVLTWRMPTMGGDPSRGIAAVRAYLEASPAGIYAVRGAFWIGAAFDHSKRSDDAVTAFESFLEGRGYRLPGEETASKPLPGEDVSPAALKEKLLREATFRIARIRFAQKRYEDAIASYERYVTRFPNGPSWAASQEGIVNSRYMLAIEALADGQMDRTRERFKSFLRQYPLDARSRKVMFILGQMLYHEAETLEKKDGEPAAVRRAFGRAADEWMKLVGKYKNTEESSVALYRVGLIREEKLGDLDKALAAYRQLTWGSKAPAARARVAMMTQKELEVETRRAFHTDESPQIKLRTRNIKKITIRQYFLDLEPYFRKTHGIGGIEALDIALIQPDRTWDLEVAAYARYKPLLHEIPVPFEEGRAGVCIVNISEDDLEATTLVIRSDLDLILKSSRKEVLAFVQNRRTGKPAANVRVLLSDGKKVFAKGTTGADGVFKGQFKELKDLDSVRVFAIGNGSVASNALNLKGLGLSKGLTPRGYIYSDRPAYLPGEEVGIRGILRETREGSYATPKEMLQILSVRDGSGRLVWQQEVTLSRFGTFSALVKLADGAPLGDYTISTHPKDKPENAHSGSFKVARFQLQKMKLVLETPRDVYYRGEKVELAAVATWFWGEPLRKKEVTCTLPDGVMTTAKTDAQGRATFSFDTSGLTGGGVATFRARLPGEGVDTVHRIYVSRTGFDISVSSSHPVALSGEPFDAVVKTTTPDGKPCARDLVLTVLLRTAPRPIPILQHIPWGVSRVQEAGEVTVGEYRASTDPKTGEALVPIKLKKGGQYTLRVSGTDRFEQVVTASTRMRVSDDEDATRLRLFAKTSRLEVGGSTRIRLHSRAAPGLALLTIEGEEIIEYRILEVSKGYTDLDLEIGHGHFPNFRAAVAMMDGRTLRQAARPFTVERQLRVTVRPVKDHYLPGEDGRVDIVVTDHLGQPVEAELSLALVNEALFSVHPDRTQSILDFFQKGVVRQAEFRTISTCNFAYKGTTRPVIKAFLEEEERKRRQVAAQQEYAQSRSALKRLLKDKQSQVIGRSREALEKESQNEPAQDADSSKAHARFSDMFSADRKAPAKPQTSSGYFQGGKAGESAREEVEGAGFWVASIVTDKNGKATLNLPMPETTTEWRLTARACTTETLVGEAKASTVTRKDFFVSFKAPSSLLEGDQPRLLARIHNLTDWKGTAKVQLLVKSGGRVLFNRSADAKLTGEETAEVLFQDFRVPAVADLDLEVSVAGGKHKDAVVRNARVRPWGLEYADHAGGASTGPVRVALRLPSGREYGSQWLSLSVAPTPRRALVAMALGRYGWTELELKRGRVASYWGHIPGGELLAAVSALDHASGEAMAEDRRRILGRARALIATLVVSQRKDGGWNWPSRSQDATLNATALAYRALARAAAAGLAVHQDTLAKSRQRLLQEFQRGSSNDLHRKALILHALSVTGHADFAPLNRLYRQRNQLAPSDVAALALSFENQKRHQIATELVRLLEESAQKSGSGSTALAFWDPGSSNRSWSGNRVEATAMALLAIARIHPGSALAKPAADWLLHQRGCGVLHPSRARGPVIAALAARFRDVVAAERDFRIVIKVNDKVLETLTGKGLLEARTLRVPTPSIVEGENRIEFAMQGRGEFTWAATLSGFSSSFERKKNLRAPYVKRRLYLHAPLRYRGRPISASSSSVVKNIENGQHVRVQVTIPTGRRLGRYTVVEESLPAGFTLLPGSLSGRYSRFESEEGRLVIVVPPARYVSSFSYALVGSSPGKYRILPTVIRDLVDPGQMTIGFASDLTVLGPGEESKDRYVMNDSERFHLGKAYFEDGHFDQALRYLRELHDRNSEYHERDVARMLLWIATRKDSYDAKLIVDMFEVLRERYPDLFIPFDKILVVGRAYSDLGEHERSWLVFRATVDASFIKDSNVSAVLQDEGQLMGSIDFQKRLWREYPDTPEVVSAWFALSQSLYKEAPRAAHWAKLARAASGNDSEDEKKAGPTSAQMWLETVKMLNTFLVLYPEDPLSDDAAFSLTNALMELKDYERVVAMSEEFMARYPKSEFAASFRYMTALGYFWQRSYEPALAAAKGVAEGDTKDKELARYIMGQIYHAGGNAAEAIRWYEQVKKQYPDAREAIGYFQKKRISLPEVTVFEPGKPVEVKLTYRNIKEASLQIYKVDLMRLYLREKNLKNITRVNLAGIASQLELSRVLGDGRDYRSKEIKLALDLKDEGAYLVICRGDDLFTSGLVVVTPLKIEAQEDAQSGRVRVNVLDVSKNQRPAGVHVKAIGSGDTQFRSGETDLRGLFVADDVNGRVTVIARDGSSRYAFYRGKTSLGAGDRGGQAGQRRPAARTKNKVNYRSNLLFKNESIQELNLQQFDQLRRQQQKGVQIKKAK